MKIVKIAVLENNETLHVGVPSDEYDALMQVSADGSRINFLRNRFGREGVYLHESFDVRSGIRDRLAVAALTGMLASAPSGHWINAGEAAKVAYEYADAMLVESKK